MVIGICDDERCYHKTILIIANTWQKEKHPDLVLSIKNYETAEALASDWERGIHFDLLFLDIKLPFDSGLSLAKEIRKTDPYVPIVFITSHPQYAIEGYEADPFRYLPKPLQESSVHLCLEHAYTLLPTPDQPNLVAVRNGAHIRLPLSRIVSISCGSHQAIITVADDPGPYSLRFSGSFEEFLKTVPPAPFFLRCHNSHMINTMYIESISRSDIRMMNGHSFPISRSYRKEVTAHLQIFVHGGLTQ